MRFIGRELYDRMKLLGIDISTLSELTFIDEEIIEKLINNKIAYEDIDEFDLSLISNALHCDDSYFINDEVRNRDLLVATMNRGKDTIKSRKVKAKIQDYLRDYAFLNEIILEEA